ncbi:hypothetical protein L9F63_014517, partial [Diploptera punctata]
SSSNLLAKSAPSTPQGERLQAGTAFPATTQTTAPPGPPPRSPSHVFNRHDNDCLVRYKMPEQNGNANSRKRTNRMFRESNKRRG